MRPKTKASLSNPRTVRLVAETTRFGIPPRCDVCISIGSWEMGTSIRGEVSAAREPSIVATSITRGQRRPIAVGSSAVQAAGEMKAEVKLVRPIVGDVVVDFEAAEWLIEGMVRKTRGRAEKMSEKNRLQIRLSPGSTRTERHALLHAAEQAWNAIGVGDVCSI